jgi:drug/metabolite transporter (DMT)-like permease
MVDTPSVQAAPARPVPPAGVARRLAIRGKAVRTYSLLALFVFMRPFGNLSLAWGTKHFPQVFSLQPWVYLRAMADPFVALGIALLILALLTRMALLSLADLSFILPVTAVGYVLSALFGNLFLHELVTPRQWLGTLLIFGGTALVGSTSHNTTHPRDEAE